MSAREMFPYFTDEQCAIAERLRQVFGENMAIAMIRQAGGREEQVNLLNAFATHGSASAAEAIHQAAQLKAQLEQGIAEMRELSGISTRLQHENELLRRQPAERVERPRAVKLDVPKYEGKESENVLRWLVQVQKGADALKISEENVRVDYAMSHLSGRAQDWALTRCMADEDCFPTYATFVRELKGMFLPPNSDFRVRANFLASKQGSKALNVYIQDLRALCASMVEEVPESTKVTVFMRGIKQGPARTQLFREFPQTLEEAFRIAIAEEYSQHMARGNPAAIPDHGDMDVSAMAHRDLSAVKCFNCGKMGHMAHSCTTPRSAKYPDTRQQGRPRYGRERFGDRREARFGSRGPKGNVMTQ
jgi:hypothetical protein